MKHSDVVSSKRGGSFILGLIMSILVLVIESIILLLNVEYITVTSIEELLISPIKLCIHMAYTLSVILVPLVSTITIDFVEKIVDIYKLFVVKSLKFESIKTAQRCAKAVPMLISLSLLFIILGVFLRIYIFLLFSLIPLAAYMVMLLKPVYDVYNHGKNIDSELPWFLILLTIIESVKASIKMLIDKLRCTSILPAITEELLIIDRDSKLYGLSHISALTGRANITPNIKLANLFAGYASKLRSGGDVLSWLRSRLSEELLLRELSLRLYSERVITIFGQLMLLVYAILPLISISILAINIYNVLFMNIVITPLLVFSVYVIQPKSLNNVPVFSVIILPFLTTAMVSLLLYRIIGGHSIALGWFLAIIISLKYGKILKEIEILDKDSIEILKMMVELRRAGLDIAKSLEYISLYGPISKATAKKLKLVLNMLSQGIPLIHASVMVPINSFLFKFLLFTLGLVHECGSNDPDVFQMLYEYVGKTRALRTITRKGGLFFDIFAFINIFLLVWVWKALLPLYTVFNVAGVVPSISSNIDVLFLLMYTSSLCYSMVSSTIRRGFPIFELRNIVFLLACIASIIIFF